MGEGERREKEAELGKGRKEGRRREKKQGGKRFIYSSGDGMGKEMMQPA